MGLFSKVQMAQIMASAEKSKQLEEPPPKTKVNAKNLSAKINEISAKVVEHFKDSKAELITAPDALHDYISKMLKAGIGAIDTETTGLDKIKDTIVGVSLYYPGGVEVYIPIKHIVPIFDEPYKDQLTYEQVAVELQRLADSNIKLIFANADFDLAMIFKDLKVDLLPVFWYDVIIAWRCIKEDEKDNSLKGLYTKYPLKGQMDRMKFSDFFTADLFPYCNPQVAKLYAAADAKYTYELCMWQLPYLKKDNPKCQKHHFEAIADLVWGVEFPLTKICQLMHRRGIYLEKSVAAMLRTKYHGLLDAEYKKMYSLLDAVLNDPKYFSTSKRPFKTAKDFNPNSTPHVKWLCYDWLRLGNGKTNSTDKSVLSTYNHPLIAQILKCRSLVTLIGTFVDKLPDGTTDDSRIHCTFKQLGARTGRLSSSDPNMQNIPSKSNDIRHMFRATPGYIMLSSDYSQQEPKLTAFISQDPDMIKAFQENKDIYSFIASIAFNKTYEECKEFTPTGEYNPDGKARRTSAKSIVLGVLYGRSIPSIADQLYSHEDWDDEKKVKQAQFVYDSVLNAFPALRRFMISSQKMAHDKGYVETILGRRRHIPDMMLPEFEFQPMPGYVNPDIDPLDPSTFTGNDGIPKRIQDKLYKELTSYKYFGQKAKRIKELAENYHIKVINNSHKISEASRQCVNSCVQGSAADLTKLAMIEVENDPIWNELGGRVILQIHDELVGEVPIEHWKEGGERLSQLMCEAASFLPFTIKCDVTTSYRWYGLEYPCPYKETDNVDTEDPDEVKYIQYHLFEVGYDLPVFKNPDGSKPEGDEALGVNGIVTEDYKSHIADYCNRYSIPRSDFLYHIKTKVHTGFAPNQK